MIVTVTDRVATDATWGHPGPHTVITRTVEIADTCPVCGGPRGKPVKNWYCEEGHYYAVDNWTNPCGHRDEYKRVLEEAK